MLFGRLEHNYETTRRHKPQDNNLSYTAVCIRTFLYKTCGNWNGETKYTQKPILSANLSGRSYVTEYDKQQGKRTSENIQEERESAVWHYLV